MESFAVVAGQCFECFLVVALDAYSDMEVLECCQIVCVGGIMTDEDAVCLKNEEEIFRDEGQDLYQMIPSQGGFVPADANVFKTLLSGDPNKTRSDLLGRIELASTFWMGDNRVRPAKDAAQEAAHTIGRGDAAIERGRPEAVVFTLIASGDDFADFPGFLYWIDHDDSKPPKRPRPPSGKASGFWLLVTGFWSLKADSYQLSVVSQRQVTSSQ